MDDACALWFPLKLKFWSPLWTELNQWTPITNSSTLFSNTIIILVPSVFTITRSPDTFQISPNSCWFSHLDLGKMQLEKLLYIKLFWNSVAIGLYLRILYSALILRTITPLSQIEKDGPIFHKMIFGLSFSTSESRKIGFDKKIFVSLNLDTFIHFSHFKWPLRITGLNYWIFIDRMSVLQFRNREAKR